MLFKIDFDFKNKKFVQNMIEVKNINQDLDLDLYYKSLDCQCIDIVNYSDQIAIVIDDEGLLKSNNPVFKLNDNNGSQLHLAGPLLFAKNHYGRDGVSLRGLDAGEVINLIAELKLKIIGITR